MVNEGWFRLYRSALSDEDRLWKEERPRTRWEAWVDMIQLAAWEDHEVIYDGALITVERGQIPTSERKLADRWNWSRKKVRHFLSQLEACSRCVRNRSRKGAHGLTIITLCNYSTYQGGGATEGPTKGPTEGPRRAQTEEVKEGKEDNSSISRDVLRVFVYWCNQRAKAIGKASGPRMKLTQKRRSKIRARLREGYTLEQLKEAIDGCLSNPFNIQGGHTDLELICRDQQHVEQYRTWERNGSPGKRTQETQEAGKSWEDELGDPNE